MSEGVAIVTPELKCSYLFDYLVQAGLTKFNGMDYVPLDWNDLASWKHVTGVPLNAWETRVIHKASEVYVNQLGLSRKADCPMPERLIDQDPLKLAKRIKSVLR